MDVGITGDTTGTTAEGGDLTDWYSNGEFHLLYRGLKYFKKQVKSWADDMVDYYYTKPKTYFKSLYEVDSKKEFEHRAFWDDLLPGHPYTTYDNMKDLENYMDFYGLDWSDIKNPSKTRAYSSSGSSSVATLNYVSSNVSRIYRRFR